MIDSDTKKPLSVLTMKHNSPVKHASEVYNGSHSRVINANVINLDKVPLMVSTSGSERIQLLQPAVLQPTIFSKQMNDAVKTISRNESRTSHSPSKDEHLKTQHLSDITVKPSKELVQRHIAARKILRRQLDRKLSNVPYPKTYRQVWPVIPVGDSLFLSTVGLEAACSALDPTFKSKEPKRRPSNAPKPVCQQCGSDFAPAWQVRKKNDSTYLLCEMCDFANLKNVHREKIATQLKECSAMIDKEFSEIDRKFESDLRGQVANSVSNLFQNHTSSSLSIQSGSDKLTQPTAIAQSVIQSSGSVPGGNLAVPSAAQIQSLMDSTQKMGSSSGSATTKDVDSANRLSALERNLQQRSGALLDVRKKRDKKGKSKSPSEHVLHGVRNPAVMKSSKPKKLKHPGGERTLDKMLEMMKTRAMAVPIVVDGSPTKDVLELSDNSCTSSPVIKESTKNLEKHRSRKPTAPKHVRRPLQAEVLPSSSPNSCIVVIDAV